MPNWCSGNIRFRGKKDDVIKLLKENIIYCKYQTSDKGRGLGETMEKPAKVEVDEDWEVILSSPYDDPEGSWCYIGTTHRNFLSLLGTSDTTIHSAKVYQDEKVDEFIVVFDSFQAAWGIDPEPYVTMSEKYHVDIKIIGFEQGMGFDQYIEIIDGDLVKNEGSGSLGSYGKWVWESTLPYLGG